ncbi:hypothetical protein SAY86_004265 [Trapa natans]|uniref:RIN4 pathogenic type III effector avirulence factor Avr cleavage site domain-containing protein n=1 Tax=Trapa natans TaxID=22666 RepID=A0AAN7M7F8_TRANT|nr:hypothetical protein SAY86_004265 [Trapa natans]
MGTPICIALRKNKPSGSLFLAKCILLVLVPACIDPENGRSLPKFGEWDVNNPASAEGFTVIFTKARNEKKSNGAGPGGASSSTYH